MQNIIMVSGRIKQIERNAKQLKVVQDRINSTKNILEVKHIKDNLKNITYLY